MRRRNDLTGLGAQYNANSIAAAIAAANPEAPGELMSVAGSQYTLPQLVAAIMRAELTCDVPLGSSYGKLRTWEHFPGPNANMPWDPLKAALINVNPSNQHFFAKATESSGSATATVTAAVGTYTEISTWKIAVTTDPDEQGTEESLMTMTFAPVDINKDLIRWTEDSTSGVSTTSASTEVNTFRFAIEDGAGGVYWHLARRPSDRPLVSWTKAMIATPVADGKHPSGTFAAAATSLVSGSLVSTAVTGITANAAGFPEYACHMLQRYYAGY